MPRHATRSLTAVLLFIALVGCTLTLQGCYERTVGARGLGASNVQLQEPYQENSKLDDWILGEKKTNDRYRRIGE